MLRETIRDKNTVVSILSKAFTNNKSVNFVINNKKARIPLLMRYSYHYAQKFGKVFVSKNRKAVVLLVLPEKKKVTLSTLFWDIKLVLFGIGITRLFKILKRERLLKPHQPKNSIHLWYIGVDPSTSGKGIGSALLKKVVAYCNEQKRSIYLETSTIRNIAFYEKNGFIMTGRIEKGLPYTLYIFKKDADGQ